MPSLVSLVMSDIVGSTRRWAADDAAMAADLEAHDGLVRGAIVGAGGRVFKHTGDGMIAAFDDPVEAIGAAASVQRAIGQGTWRHPEGLQVRVAVHAGVVYERDGDMYGTAVNKVARLLDLCPPGSVLVSNAVATLVAERAPEGLELRAVGMVQLKGFTSTDAAFALVGYGVGDAGPVPATHSSGRRGGELPSIDDELVGRTGELAGIWDELSRHRLVTLTGVGGMGKTRLALEVAAGAAESFADGAWWVDLSAATAPEAVIPVAMAAIGARETPGRSPLQALCDLLAAQSAVVVLDNCEHVLGAARELVGAIRSAAPEARLVCTSREALGVRGEQIVPVGSLPVADGVELFIERAVAVRPDLDIDADRAVIERLCTRLDGIPLAIELAAARCRSMSPDEIDVRLDDRFRLLRGGRSGAERHRTLQAAVAWSYSLLDPDERAVFDQMAVFAGGTLIDGLATVCHLDELDALDIVDRLVGRSMVVAARTPLGTRYHQLETLRQYAEDRLVDSATIADIRDRHLDWAAQLAEWIDSRRGSPDAAHASTRFTADLDNLRVAVAHATGTGRHALAQQIVADVYLFALDRPAWEVTDWVLPLHVEGGWTEDAAVCAAAASHFDEQRFGPRGREYPVGGVPVEFVESNPDIALCQTANLGWNGCWAEAIDFTDRVRFADEYAQCWVTSMRVFSLGFGVNERGALAAEVDELIDLALGNLARARRTGDQQAIAHASYFASYALLEREPLPAIEHAREAIEIAEQLGSHYLLERSMAVELTARSTAAALGQLPLDDVAPALRAQLARSFELSHLFMVGTLARATARLLAPFDPTAAALVAYWVRNRSGMPVAALVKRRLEADPGYDQAAVDARVATLTAADMVRVALEALDRLIAR